jgi:general nucleoside transport system permease protein
MKQTADNRCGRETGDIQVRSLLIARRHALLSTLPPPVRATLRIAGSLLLGFVACAGIALCVDIDPRVMLSEWLKGAVEGPQLFETVSRSVPLVGMALSAAVPLRAGIVNLGADGQLVLGGCAAAIVALYMPGPPELRMPMALLLGAAIGGAYGMLAALGELYARVPLLLSTWLLTYPAKGICGYLVRSPLRDPVTAWPSSYRIEAAARLPQLIQGTPLNYGLVVIAVLAVLAVCVDRRTAVGYEIRMRGLNERFALYGGVALGKQTVWLMFASGALAGLVGAIMVLGSQYRFTDGALTAPQYSWSGTLAALLAGGDPLASVVAAVLFAALQTGGFAMERSVEVPRVLTMVLQSMVILFLAMRGATWRRLR